VQKSAGKSLGIPAEFPKTKKSAGNYSELQNPQKKPYEYLRIIFRRKFRSK
jgi:hypothetical protein